MVVMLYVRYPPSLLNVEDLLFERGYDLCHETVRLDEYEREARAAIRDDLLRPLALCSFAPSPLLSAWS